MTEEWTVDEYKDYLKKEGEPKAPAMSGSKRDYEQELCDMLVAAELPTPVQQHKFSPDRKWRFDLAWPDRWLALEVEGGTYGRTVQCQSCNSTVTQTLKDGRVYPVRLGGRHNTGSGYEKDLEKYNTAAKLGWRVLRVTTNMVSDGRALLLMIDVLLEVKET